MKSVRSIAAASALLVGCGMGGAAHAALTLTADAKSLGFVLTTFATINPGFSAGLGPLGVAVAGNRVLVSNIVDSKRYSFADTDGQTLASALSSTSSDSSVRGYATVGGKAYGEQKYRFVQFKSDGTVDHVLSDVTPRPMHGMWGNLTNGHIVATSYSGLIDINPLSNGGKGSFRVFANVKGDGLSVSPDGKTAFLAASQVIPGFSTYDIATGKLGYSVDIAGADGIGVIHSTNALDGNVVVNTNFGNIYMYDPKTKASTLLAQGGTRGDFVSPDPTNGTLFLDYSDIVARLSCGKGCGIGSPPMVPEPETYAMMAAGLGVIGWVARRRKAKEARA